MAKLKFEAAREDEEPQGRPGAGDDKGVIEKVEDFLIRAITAGATDIHVEPHVEQTVVRGRVTGQLTELATFPSSMHHKIVNRFKILSAMDITKTKIAQRGYFKVESEEMSASCNAVIFPTTHGEKVTLELLYSKGVELSLEHLGFFTEILKSFKDALNKPHGLVLVVGPPASGRTTTCYAALAALNSPQKALATFETQHKYELAGAIQGKPSPIHDFSFEDGVRIMMESNPDVCLVGDVPSPAVARSMLQGAFAKRIVIGRMAAHDSVNAIATLLDMGMEPYLLIAAVDVILAQRLLRRICDHCKEAYTPPEQLVAEIGYKMRSDMKFYRGKGCAACGGTGYLGHIALFELLQMGEAVSELVVARRSPAEIREEAARQGMVPLKRDGVNKVVMGYTSIEEVLNSL